MKKTTEWVEAKAAGAFVIAVVVMRGMRGPCMTTTVRR